MSFLDNVSDAWDWSKEHAEGSLGGAFAGAGTLAKDEAETIGGSIKDAVTHTWDGLMWVSNGAARGYSTLQAQGNNAASLPNSTPASRFGYFFNGHNWSTAWDASANISPGQATMTGLGLGLNQLGLPTGNIPKSFDMTPEAIQARKDFDEGTWYGRLSTGGLDLAWDFYADPTVIAGKALGAARLARTAFKNADEIETVLKLHSGDLTVPSMTRRQTRLVNHVDDLLRNETNGSAAEIAMHPILRNTANGANFAYLFGQANKITDATERLAAKRDIYGVMLGNADAKAALAEKQAMLSHELDRLTSPPPQPWAMHVLDWGDGGFKVLDDVNKAPLPEVERQIADIDGQLDHLDRILSDKGLGVGATNQYNSTMLQRAGAAMAQTTIQAGIGHRPVRLVASAMSNILPGHISVKDVNTGFESLRQYLSQAVDMAPDAKSAFLNSFLKAASPMERTNVLKAAEAEANRTTALKYGLDPVGADTVLTLGRRRADAVLSTVRGKLGDSQLYSSADGARSVAIYDPELDEIVVAARPVWESQTEDMVHMIPPPQLRKAYKLASDTRLTGKLVGQTVADVAGATKDRVNQGLTSLTRLWKDNVLFRLAYPIRVQVDTQARQMAYMGALSYLASRGGIVRAVRANASTPGSKFNPLFLGRVAAGTAKNVLTGNSTPVAIQMLKDANGFDDETAQMVLRMITAKGGNTASTLAATGDNVIGNLRASGQWSDVLPQDPTWAQQYADRVNMQLRNSAIGMAAIGGKRGTELRYWAQSHPEGRAAWRAMRASYAGDMDQWLQKATIAADHLLPEQAMKDVALKRNITVDDVAQWYEGKTKPVVHGESYLGLDPTGPWEKFSAWYNRVVRQNFYQMANEGPEDVLGRVPTFNYSYQNALKGILDRYQAEKITELSPAEIHNAQRTAIAMARKDTASVLYDASHTSNIATMFPSIAPFFAPVEDVLKKWGTLFYNKPWTAKQFQYVMNAPYESGSVHDEHGNRVDEQGNVYDVLTGERLDPSNPKDSGRIGKQRLIYLPTSWIPQAVRKATGIDQMKVNTKSLNIIFQGDTPFLPGAGPVVAAPVNYLVGHMFPELENNKVVQQILPYGAQDGSMAEQFLNGTERNLFSAFLGGPDYDKVYLSVAKAEDANWRNGARKDKPTGEEIAKKTRNWLLMRAATSFASPVSLTPTPEAQLYQDWYSAYQQRAGQYATDHPGQKVLSAEQAWYRDFPQYFAMTAHLNTNDTGIKMNLKSVDEVKAHQAAIAANPQFGWAIVGPDGMYGNTADTRYSSGAAEWLRTNNVKPGDDQTYAGHISPEDALGNARAQEGWIVYNQGMTKLDLSLEERGLHSISQRGAEDLAQAKQTFMDQMAATFPDWKKDYDLVDMGKVTGFLGSMYSAMKSDRSLANRPDMVALGQYMVARDAYQRQLDSRQFGSIDAKNNADLKFQWDQFVSSLSRQNIGFAQMYNRILQKDDLSKDFVHG